MCSGGGRPVTGNRISPRTLVLTATGAALLVLVISVRTAGESGPDPTLCDHDPASDIPAGAPGTARDCAILLEAMATLAGTAALDWSASRPVATWQGVVMRDGRITQLRLGSSGLTGSIPGELGGLSALEELHLDDNGLTGSIPRELAGLPELDELNLSGNRLTGGIPAELGRMSQLDELDLSGNGLTGSIPAELGDGRRLERLNLSDNALTGEIPPELGNLPLLEELALAGNGLTGEIPAALEQLQYLKTLDLRSNGLTGSIPNAGGWRRLTAVWLGGNDLAGCVPDDIPVRTHFNQTMADLLSTTDVHEIGLPLCP